MISVTPIVVPMADLDRWCQGAPLGAFPSRGWPHHVTKQMETAVNLIPDDHLYFTFLAQGELSELVALGWRTIRFGGDRCAVLSGSLREWVDEINIHCRDDTYPSHVRRFYNSIVVFLIHIGLDRLWSSQYKNTLLDGTFIFNE